MVTWVIEVTEFNTEVRCDLQDHLEATMATEATKVTDTGNMHMDIRVIEVSDFISEFKSDLRGQQDLKATQILIFERQTVL